MRRVGEDRGSAAVELPVGIGFLLVPIVLVLVTVPGLVEHRTVARLAAAEAARVVVLGDGSPDSAATAVGVARRLTAGYESVDVELCGGGCVLTRGGVVEVRVTVRVPALSIPMVGEVGAIEVSAVHREQVDAYRSLP